MDTFNAGVVPSVCDAEAGERSRATIIAQLATVLCHADASITNIESVITRAGLPVNEICSRFGGRRELLVAMASELSSSMSASLTFNQATGDWRQRLLGPSR